MRRREDGVGRARSRVRWWDRGIGGIGWKHTDALAASSVGDGVSISCQDFSGVDRAMICTPHADVGVGIWGWLH